jgi:hypothetical protein
MATITMTRKQAIEKVACAVNGADPWTDAAAHVDALVALGMLKLDEPKSPTERLCKELGWGGMNQAALESALSAAGLRIVEA